MNPLKIKILSLLLISFALIFQACGRKPPAQEACNFLQDKNQQRVSWKTTQPISFLVHESVPKDAYEAISEAVEVWNKALGRPLFRIDAWGVSGPGQPTRDGYNVIYWMKEWGADKAREQASTTVIMAGHQILEADIRINNKNYQFHRSISEEVAGVDLMSLMVHELGHAAGKTHPDDRTLELAEATVMAPSLSNNQARRELSKFDVAALQCEYGG